MEVILNQSYEMNNLVSLTGSFNVTQFQKEIINIVNSFKDYAVNNGEYIITTTKSVQIVEGEQILEVEALLPVNYRIPVAEPYSYKNKIKIVNALYMKIDDVAKLQAALEYVNQYILEQRILPITSAYLVQTAQEGKPCTEIYIGINPNSL